MAGLPEDDIIASVRSQCTYTFATAIALLGAVAVVSWPWVHPSFDWSVTFDGQNHLTRIYLFYTALRAGQWFPRWLPDLYLASSSAIMQGRPW